MNHDPSVEYEYGIVHSQGRATMRSERDALEQLPDFVARHESNFRDKTRPYIVRREVGPWVRLSPASTPEEGPR